jgi:hypothetical protein
VILRKVEIIISLRVVDGEKQTACSVGYGGAAERPIVSDLAVDRTLLAKALARPDVIERLAVALELRLQGKL